MVEENYKTLEYETARIFRLASRAVGLAAFFPLSPAKDLGDYIIAASFLICSAYLWRVADIAEDSKESWRTESKGLVSRFKPEFKLHNS